MFADIYDVPRGGESFDGIIAQGEFGLAVNRDVIVVIKHRETIQAKKSGERPRFVTYSFFEAAVAGNHPRSMVDETFAEGGSKNAFGERHSHGVGNTLT